MSVTPLHFAASPSVRQDSAVVSGVIGLYQRDYGMKLQWSAGLALLLYLILVGGTALILLIAEFLGFKLFTFDPLALKPRDIEFVIIENPPAKPRDPNTKRRSDKASRAGGQKTKAPQAETHRKAGAPKKPAKAAAPSPAPRKATPQPKPAPKAVTKPTQRPVPTPNPTPSPKPVPTPPKSQSIANTVAPPMPKLPKPSPVRSQQPVLPPSPVAPTIKMPSIAPPKVAMATGPIASASSGSRNGSTSASGGGASGGPRPSLIGGSTGIGSAGRGSSGSGSSGSSGSVGGNGGNSSYNQSGSAGGGGGRPGIDALPEPDYGAYMAELQRRIKRNWRPPTAQEDKRVVVLFKIGRDGHLISTSIVTSSGFSEADGAALAAVKLSAPFRPLPAGHKDNDLAVQFTFDYNVFKGGGGGSSRYYR